MFVIVLKWLVVDLELIMSSTVCPPHLPVIHILTS